MTRRLRRSLAAKLIAGGCVLAMVVVGGVASYLIFSRTTQTRAAAASNADNRVGVMEQVLQRFTAIEALTAANGLAAQPALGVALSGADPPAAVHGLFASVAAVDVSGDVLMVSDADGALVYTQAAPNVASVTVTRAPPAVRTALNGGTCARGTSSPTPGGCGIELLSDGSPAYVVALPVAAGGRIVGAVAYAAPLSFQLERFQALFGFPTAFVSSSSTGTLVRPGTDGATAATDPALRAALTHPGTTYRAVYEAPTGGGNGTVAASFVAVRGSSGQVTGYIGVEVPLAQFTGDERSDILVVALIAIFVLLLVTLAVVLFVERFVKRPIARLERGVARIADGDYRTGIVVASDDELGRLATNVNRMRDSIAGYVDQIEAARARQDAAVERVRRVSRALTATTTGVPSLQRAVLRAAVSMAGDDASALLLLLDGEERVAAATEGDPPPLEEWDGFDAVLRGESVRLENPAHGVMVAVPMFYQDAVVGALAVVTTGADTDEVDVDVLGVLANNAAIAMENARLFEQERETVRRLLELDSLKTDFLSTVQHELRTPLTAILGLSDLLEMCWEMWSDEPKMEAVHDIQVAAKNLYDIVETIIDFSALEDAKLGLEPVAVSLREALTATVETVGERYKGGLPVPVSIEGNADVLVDADPARLTQVLRALVDNAVKFSDGRGAVTARFEPVEGRHEVRIEVADEGIGIPAEDVPRVFDRFFQVDNSATRRFGGTGMGLALVKRMVQAHGARIEVESVLGEGTRVVLHWPGGAPPAAGRSKGGGRGRRRAAPRPPALPVQ